MKVLMIGGTGTISSSITKALSQREDVELYLLNRGNNNKNLPENIKVLIGDINDEEKVRELIKDYHFDVVCNFLVYSHKQAEANIRLFKDNTKQFVFISTAVVYNREKAVVLNEESEKYNSFSQYGREKLLCEEIFLNAYKDPGVPITIIRPTQTYDDKRIPLSVKGKGCYPVIKRIKEGKEVIIHGDGTSTWVCTHSDDFAKAFIRLLGNKETINNVYQITSDEIVDWNIIYSIIAEELGVDLKPVYIPTDILAKSKKYDLAGSIQGDKRYSVVFDNSKLKTLVPDFKPSISIREGIKRYLDNLEKDKSLQVHEPDFDIWCDEVIKKYKEVSRLMEEVI